MIELKPEELQTLVNDDAAFRMWTINRLESVSADLRWFHRVLTPSLLLNIILGLGAVAEVFRLMMQR
jgi:hypothetical protein